MPKILFFVKHTFKWMVIVSLCLILIRWAAIAIVDEVEITHGEYGDIKLLVRTRCPLLAELVVDMIKEEGYINYKEFDLFIDTCRTHDRLKNWRPMPKLKLEGEHTA